MSKVISRTLSMSSSTGYVIDLGRKVGYVNLKSILASGAQGSCVVRPVVVEAGGTVPTAPGSLNAASPVLADNSREGIFLLADPATGMNHGQEHELGQIFASGYDPASQGEAVATHLVIYCTAAMTLNVIAH